MVVSVTPGRLKPIIRQSAAASAGKSLILSKIILIIKYCMVCIDKFVYLLIITVFIVGQSKINVLSAQKKSRIL